MPTWLDKILNSQFVMIGLAGLAFLIALWLVIVIVRMMTGGRLRFNGGRTRQARLGIVDAFDLDRQRQLIIVRRDNTEHLIMIGGPNDLVIESEIVRVEARENRRATDKSDGLGDARIPAPTATLDGLAPAAEEPMLPMPLPAAAGPVLAPPGQSPSEAPARRTPTFPLPPRPPAPPPPERRPPPPPESVSRADDPAPPPPAPTNTLSEVAPVPAEAAAPLPVEAFPPAPPIPPQPLPPIVPTQGTDIPPRPPVRPPPPSFLKPLPPRPPIRPLRRATPVVPNAPGAPAPTAAPMPQPEVSAEPPAVEAAAPAPHPVAEAPVTPVEAAPSPPMIEPAPPAAAEAKPAAAEAKPAPSDALESLEEEMAKLLGRG